MVVHTQAEYDAWRGGRGCVLVPTMGALHAGHAALIAIGAALVRARGLAGCAVTIFVNPTQFNEPADFERYPRTLGADVRLCRDAGAACVFVPSVETVYPTGARTEVQLPEVATRPGLEDAFRPGHFAGVCRVVSRLFELTRPTAAVFGAKDWQQLQVVRAMGHGVEIVPGATVREADGLAMSSRNRFLRGDERGRAVAVWRALTQANAQRTAPDAEAAMMAALQQAGLEVEYAAVRDAETLGPVGAQPARALIAARLGSVRLIDNAPWVERLASL